MGSPRATRFLVVGPSWVGDMVMAQSLFITLRQHHPDAPIDVIAPAWTLPLLERMPEVAEGIPLPFGHGQFRPLQRWRVGSRLRERHHSQAIVLPGSWKSALIPFAARIPTRTGYRGELRFGLLNDIRPLDKARLRRTVDRFIQLGVPPRAPLPDPIPLPRLRSQRADGLAVLARLGRSVPTSPVLGLCPGAEYGPAKRWPAEHFAAVARHHLDRGGEVWLFGSGKDAAITASINGLTCGRCLDLGGRTQLGEAIDLLALADAVVTNDSGLMHVAAALGRPVVALYGSSDPGFTPPLDPQARILRLGLDCSPCFKRTCPFGHTRCLQDLLPEQVLAVLHPTLAA